MKKHQFGRAQIMTTLWTPNFIMFLHTEANADTTYNIQLTRATSQLQHNIILTLVNTIKHDQPNFQSTDMNALINSIGVLNT